MTRKNLETTQRPSIHRGIVPIDDTTAIFPTPSCMMGTSERHVVRLNLGGHMPPQGSCDFNKRERTTEHRAFANQHFLTHTHTRGHLTKPPSENPGDYCVNGQVCHKPSVLPCKTIDLLYQTIDLQSKSMDSPNETNGLTSTKKLPCETIELRSKTIGSPSKTNANKFKPEKTSTEPMKTNKNKRKP